MQVSILIFGEPAELANFTYFLIHSINAQTAGSHIQNAPSTVSTHTGWHMGDDPYDSNGYVRLCVLGAISRTQASISFLSNSLEWEFMYIESG